MYFWHNADIFLDEFRDVIALLFSIHRESTFTAPTHVVMVTTAKLHFLIKGGINLKPLNDLGHICFCYGHH